MRNATTRLTSKGQVTIPVQIRRALGLSARDRVEFAIVNGTATVRKAHSVAEQLAGSIKWTGGPIDFAALRRQFEDDMGRNAGGETGFESAGEEER